MFHNITMYYLLKYKMLGANPNTTKKFRPLHFSHLKCVLCKYNSHISISDI